MHRLWLRCGGKCRPFSKLRKPRRIVQTVLLPVRKHCRRPPPALFFFYEYHFHPSPTLFKKKKGVTHPLPAYFFLYEYHFRPSPTLFKKRRALPTRCRHISFSMSTVFARRRRFSKKEGCNPPVAG